MGTLIADDWGCDHVPGHTDSIRHFLFEELIVNYYIILGVLHRGNYAYLPSSNGRTMCKQSLEFYALIIHIERSKRRFPYITQNRMLLVSNIGNYTFM